MVTLTTLIVVLHLISANCLLHSRKMVFKVSDKELPFDETINHCAESSMTVEKNWTKGCGVEQSQNKLWLGQVHVSSTVKTGLTWSDGTFPSKLPDSVIFQTICKPDSPCCAVVFCGANQFQLMPCLTNEFKFVCKQEIPNYVLEVNDTLNRVEGKQIKMISELELLKTSITADRNENELKFKNFSSKLSELGHSLSVTTLKPTTSEPSTDTTPQPQNFTAEPIMMNEAGFNLTTMAMTISAISLILVTVNWFFLKRQINPKILGKKIKEMETKRLKKMAEKQAKEHLEYHGQFQMIELPPDSDDDLPLPPPPDESILAITDC